MLGINWKGKFGGIVVALGGLAKVLFPDQGDWIDRLIDAITIIGGGIGIYGIREAIGTRAE